MSVDLILVFNTAKQVFEKISLLRGFIEGGEFRTLVMKVGDNSYNAALVAVQNAQRKDGTIDTDELNIAAGAFETAIQNYLSALPQNATFVDALKNLTKEFVLKALNQGSIPYKKNAEIYQKACGASIFKCICYRYLSEFDARKTELVRSTTSQAKEYFEKYAKNAIEAEAIANGTPPVPGMSHTSFILGSTKVLREKIEKERKALQEVANASLRSIPG